MSNYIIGNQIYSSIPSANKLYSIDEFHSAGSYRLAGEENKGKKLKRKDN